MASPSHDHEIRGARATARHAAIQRLIAAHPDEYDAWHREERIARGLPAQSTGAGALQAENERLRARLAELEARS